MTSIPKRINLIDGPELALLMVWRGVGVTVTKSLQLTRVDGDFIDTEGVTWRHLMGDKSGH